MPYSLLFTQDSDHKAISLGLNAVKRLGVALQQQYRLWDFRLKRQKQRRVLGALLPHELEDVGLSTAQAQHEAAKPLWRD